MKAARAELGRVFVLRLEHGERLPEVLEAFAAEQGISRGFCALVGAVDQGELVTGPADGQARPVEPLVHALTGVHEAAALGTIFPDQNGNPRLHLHAALGRGDKANTGCGRRGLTVWQVSEVVLMELKGLDMERRLDDATGFTTLEPGPGESEAQG